MKSVKDRNLWTPISKPDGTYCAPRCGAGCSEFAYLRAGAEAKHLATSLGAGWEPRVWENLGWHYSVKKGACEVYPSRNGSPIKGEWEVTGYNAYFNSWCQFIGKGNTPQIALAQAIEIAKAAATQIRHQTAVLEQ